MDHFAAATVWGTVLLVGAWLALGLTLANVLPTGSENRPIVPHPAWEETIIEPLSLSTLHPCTGRSGAVEGVVGLDVKIQASAEMHRLDIDAFLDHLTGPSDFKSFDRLTLSAQAFTVALPIEDPVQTRRFLHQVRIPLTDRLSDAVLVVSLTSDASQDGDVHLERVGSRLTCDHSANEVASPSLRAASGHPSISASVSSHHLRCLTNGGFRNG
jgi:hypothetical protein